jgi:hypothetical protein
MNKPGAEPIMSRRRQYWRIEVRSDPLESEGVVVPRTVATNNGLHRLRGTVRYPEQPFWQQETA